MKSPKSFFAGKTTYLKKNITPCDFIGNSYTVKQMDYSSDSDIESWCNIVNQSYDDSDYTIAHAKEFLTNHPFCTETNTAFFEADGEKIATISYGKIKTNKQVGSFFRIAVLPSFQNRGIGRLLLQYAESEMSKQGIGQIEESIALKRGSSFAMHFKCGYKPEIFSVQRAIRRSLCKEILTTLCGYNLVINIITWSKYNQFKKRQISGK